MSRSVLPLVKERLIENPQKVMSVGLLSVTKKELAEFKAWLDVSNIKYRHATKTRLGGKIPYNGVLYINTKSK